MKITQDQGCHALVCFRWPFGYHKSASLSYLRGFVIHCEQGMAESGDEVGVGGGALEIVLQNFNREIGVAVFFCRLIEFNNPDASYQPKWMANWVGPLDAQSRSAIGKLCKDKLPALMERMSEQLRCLAIVLSETLTE